MSQLVSQATQQLRQAVEDALRKAMAAGELPQADLPEFILEVPGDSAHGDWACNAAMAGARTFRAAPRKIAQSIVDHLDLAPTYFEKVEIAGPGFLNFTYRPAFYAGVLQDIHRLGQAYGRSDFGQGQRVLVEYVSANPTGPMHIGNARGGVLGDALSAVLEAAGYQVSREFYINDAGNQVNKYAASLEARYLQLYQGEEAVPFPEDGYQGPDVIANAKSFAELYGDKYVSAPSEERKAALIGYALPKNIQGLHDDLLRYRVEYDNWFHESTLHENGAVGRVVELLKEKGATYEKDGATWFHGEEYGSEDFVLVRSNGVPTYVVPDIAYHYDKLVTRHFDLAIDVLGADHHGYVPRLKAALTALGVDASRLEVVLMQMVRLVRDGEIVKAIEAQRQGHHPGHPAGGGACGRRPVPVQLLRAQHPHRLRPGPGGPGGQPEPGVLRAVRPRPYLLHSEEPEGRRYRAPGVHRGGALPAHRPGGAGAHPVPVRLYRRGGRRRQAEGPGQDHPLRDEPVHPVPQILQHLPGQGQRRGPPGRPAVPVHRHPHRAGKRPGPVQSHRPGEHVTRGRAPGGSPREELCFP